MLHEVTPLIESRSLSDATGLRVFVKLDALQPSGSFKIRGIGHMCEKAAANGAKGFVTASGGNAGLAVAYAGKRLGLPVVVVVPTSTPDFMRKRLADEGATVKVEGDVWDAANQFAQSLVAGDQSQVYIPAFDHPDIWQGHASLAHELRQQLQVKPAAIVCVVGGGGLMNGIILGLQKVGWNDVPIVAVETDGTRSFYEAYKAQRLVKLDGITSIAKSLGALQVSAMSLQLASQHKVVPFLVTDGQAVDACCRFADDHRILVEPACGAGLAAVYNGLLSGVVKQGDPIVVVACGGSMVTLEMLRRWKEQFPLTKSSL